MEHIVQIELLKQINKKLGLLVEYKKTKVIFDIDDMKKSAYNLGFANNFEEVKGDVNKIIQEQINKKLNEFRENIIRQMRSWHRYTFDSKANPKKDKLGTYIDYADVLIAIDRLENMK